jgi:hypothetical protein
MMKWGYYYIARTLSFGFACRFMKLRWAARVCYVRQAGQAHRRPEHAWSKEDDVSVSM